MAITESTQGQRAVLPSPAARPSPLQMADFRAVWTDWQSRRRYRQDLARLLRVGPHMIADVGLTLEDARHEAAKPFWQA